MSAIPPITGAIEGAFGAPELPKPSSLVQTKQSDPLGNMFSGMLDSVNELQQNAGAMEQSLYSNEPTELHRVMIASEEAGVATDLLLQIRNRLVEGYQELMRMPV